MVDRVMRPFTGRRYSCVQIYYCTLFWLDAAAAVEEA